MKTRMILAVLLVAVTACGERRETAAPAEPAAAPAPAPEPAAAPSVVTLGSVMPAYTAKLLDGSDFDVAKERGNVVFVNLWATWCGPCRYEIPELEKLHKDHSASKFKVVGVSVDEGGDQLVRDFVNEQKMTYPVALDPDGRLAEMLETTILPTSIILDREGKVVWKHFGVVTVSDPEMMKALEAALKS
jgi:cytochrome c biogenesis protein CcmG, thiol:disulfide interchange protein DsbE